MPFLQVFHISSFRCNDKVVCGISDNFSWQTIWDSSKKILLEEIQGSVKFSDFHKIVPFMLYNARYESILCQFCKFFTFRVSSAMTRCSAGSQIIFHDNPTETCKKIRLEEIHGSLRLSGFHKILPFMLYKTQYESIIWQFCKFFTFQVLSAGTRCSVGAEIIFHDNPTETCKKIRLEEIHGSLRLSGFHKISSQGAGGFFWLSGDCLRRFWGQKSYKPKIRTKHSSFSSLILRLFETVTRIFPAATRASS